MTIKSSEGEAVLRKTKIWPIGLRAVHSTCISTLSATPLLLLALETHNSKHFLCGFFLPSPNQRNPDGYQPGLHSSTQDRQDWALHCVHDSTLHTKTTRTTTHLWFPQESGPASGSAAAAAICQAGRRRWLCIGVF